MQRVILLFVLMMPSLAVGQAMPGHHAGGMAASPMMVTQPGQAAFAAIQEIVELLEADPKTDWTKVNIEALRQHLADMDNVTLHAEVKSAPVEGGMVFTVSGTDAVRTSIQRMVTAHATAMNGGDWQFVAATTDTGATLIVRVPGADRAKLQGLGFIGVLTRGMHHQMHHLMIARGDNPHH